MRNIKNMKELELELARLEARQLQLESGIRNDISAFKESMRPLKIAGRIISGFIKKDASHDDVLARSLGLGASKLSQKYLLANMPLAARKFLSFVIENLTVNLAASKTTPLAATLSSLIKNIFYKKSDELSPESRVTLP